MEPRISSLVEKSHLQRDDESLQASATTFSRLESSSLSLQPDFPLHGPSHADSLQDKTEKLSSQQSSEARRHEVTLVKSNVPLKEVLNDEETLRDSTSSHVTTDQNLTSSQGKDTADENLSTTKGGLITLPEPKSARKGTRRPLIPPLLQGLHQPPPDAGLFPPITANSIVPARNAASERPSARKLKQIVAAPSAEKKGPEVHLGSSSDKCKSTRQRRKWSNEETNHLVRGVAKHGIGRWKDILLDPEYAFGDRRAVDLKDRFRTCFPDECRKTEQNNKEQERLDSAGRSYVVNRSADGPAKEIYKRFPQSQRRTRRKFTKEDDAALVKGHAKYGALWHKIRDDSDLNLGTRQATDLRDRLRNVHPELFSKSDFKGNPRASTIPAVKSSASSARHVSDKKLSTNEDPSSVLDDPTPLISQAFQSEDSQPKTSTLSSTLTLPDLFSIGDEEYLFEGSTSPVILSRTILDWGENNSHQQNISDLPSVNSVPVLEMSQGIDPSMTVHSWSASSNNVSSGSIQLSTSSMPSVAAAPITTTTASKSEAFNLPPLSQTLMPFDMTVGGLLWEEYDHLS